MIDTGGDLGLPFLRLLLMMMMGHVISSTDIWETDTQQKPVVMLVPRSSNPLERDTIILS